MAKLHLPFEKTQVMKRLSISKNKRNPNLNTISVFALIVWQFLIMQSLNVYLYNYLYSIGITSPMNIAINFAVNAVLSLLVTWVSSKTVTPLTNYTCKKVSLLLWK